MKHSPQEPWPPDEQERGLQALADLMRAGAAGPKCAPEHRRRFLQTWKQETRPPARRVALMWLPLAAACSLALFVGWQWHTTNAVLQVVATRGGTSAEPSVGAMMPEGTELRFSEGTLARVQKNSRAMVSHLDARGATVTLAEGSLHLKVVKRPRAAWRVEAGPYLVQVTGTQFDVHWNEARKHFQIDLHEGSVNVSGPSLLSPQRLAAGHTLRVDGQDAPMTITPLSANSPTALLGAAPITPPSSITQATLDPLAPRARQWAYVPHKRAHARIATSGTATRAAAPVPSAAAPQPPARLESSVAIAPPRPAPTSPAPAVLPPPQPPAPVSWSTLLQGGDFAAVVHEAERESVEAVVAQRPLPDLQALADAGRYTGNAAIARKALQALRQRFAQSEAAQKATFELGRLEDDHARAPARAVPWYKQYLSESPRGVFAEDALVRLMIAHVALKHDDLAALDADKYLQLYPTGGHTDLAKKVSQRGHPLHR